MDSSNIYNIRKKDILLFFDTSFKMILYRDRDGITLFLFYLKSTFQKMCPIKQMKIFYTIHHKILFAKRNELSNIVKYVLYISSHSNFICMQVCFYFFILFIFSLYPPLTRQYYSYEFTFVQVQQAYIRLSPLQ